MNQNSVFMEIAIQEARKALIFNEVPVGAVIVKDNKIIATAHNLKEFNNDPTCHAEILAIKKACKALNNWRLNDCSMYVTLEPCPMCAGAIIQSRIKNLYIGTFDDRSGACGSVLNIVQNDSLNHWVNVQWLYNKDCSLLLENFFKHKR
ncbi:MULTISPECIES: nucleoside deaminase [Clostridium]|uniref:tRNA-specific adenosine deaminase n=1 Tax=Clostridium senegalense TaxID=1465809 RepID=A0A6M0H7H1_9CLOT|nr:MULTISPECIES: nucleoside deaminase [Clostridium]NEU06244.1 nucleoside deaminase [Clostridium senegalense]